MLLPDKENQRNRQFEGKRVVDARKAGPGGEVREERNNQRNTEYRRDDDGGREGGRGRGGGRFSTYALNIPNAYNTGRGYTNPFIAGRAKNVTFVKD